MLLLDDDDELPASPEPGEVALTEQLGPHGLQAVDAALLAHAKPTWMKVASVVHDALSSGGFAIEDDAVDLHVRRVGELVRSGLFDGQGNLHRPRFSEVRVQSLMTRSSDFLARHPRAEHPYLASIHDSFASGVCTPEPPGQPVSCDELLGIYRHRAEHLARFSTPHASDLRNDVLAFCRQLELARGASAVWWTFQMPHGVSYNFIEQAQSRALLGALKTVSKLEVDTEEWDRLWRG